MYCEDFSGAQPQFARCAIYTRFSTKMQRPASIEDQKSACRDYAAGRNWEVLDEHIYSDEAQSGTSKVKRTGLQALEQAAEQRPRPFDYVLADDTARVARDQGDIHAFIKLMRHYGIRVYFVSQTLDSGDPQFDMLLNIYSLIDAQYIKKLRSRVWLAQKERVVAGFVAGSWPYGYRPIIVQSDDPNAIGRAATKGTKLEIDEGEAAVILRIFELFASGYSMWNICVTLNREGIPSPRSVQKGIADAAWSRDAIKRILHNEKYRGIFVWNASRQLEHPKTGQIRKECKPADEVVTVSMPELRIVSDQLWDRVQTRLRELDGEHQARLLGGYNRAKNKPYLYSGLLFCGVCGSRMRIGGKNLNAVYECPNHRSSRGCTNAMRIRQDRAAAQITEALGQALSGPEALEHLVAAVHDELKSLWKRQTEEAEGEGLHDLQRNLRECEAATKNLVKVISATGSIPLAAELESLEFKKSRLEEKISVLKGAPKDRVSHDELLGLVRKNVANLLDVLQADIPAARMVLQRHVRRLHMFPSQTEDGPTLILIGEMDLFSGPGDPESGVLLGCSGTHTAQQHTDRLYRFIAEIDPRCDAECDLLEPFCALLERRPEVALEGRTPKQWAQLLQGVIPDVSPSTHPPKSGAVGWCLRNHRVILEQRFRIIENRAPYGGSPLYQLSLATTGGDVDVSAGVNGASSTEKAPL